MSINLDLSPELENQLTTEASQLNIPLSEYILQVLSSRQILTYSPKNGSERVGGSWQREEVINSRPDITDS